ncbi:MAG TPA: nucleoside triphosphate pyrophosphohydrolase [Acidimicrobiales bacterium]|nr:nucleoside triphosphate pyrophosphohydrolase [Acidimicrobiales bacterium]
MTRVVVVGLGPGGSDLLTAGTKATIDRIPTRFVRTARHPAASAVPGAVSFDDVYEKASTIDEVYRTIVDRLCAQKGEVLYAVPGSPLVAERTVELLLADPRVEVWLMPAMSFLELAWARLGVDPVAAGARLIDGHRFAVEAAGERGPLLVAQCDSKQVLSDIKLAFDDAPPATAVVLHHLGLRDEKVAEVKWEDLDRAVEPDHLTSIWLPEVAAPVGQQVARFIELVRTLRERCPWDREQTHESLSRHALEEAYELVEAIASGDPAHLQEELGDVLFQVVFHATLATEDGEFTMADVAQGIHDKLVARHPHVFGDVDADTAGEVVKNWEQIKQEEKGRTGLLDGIPEGLPALLHAAKVQRKAASIGFDWENVAQVWPKVVEEMKELRSAPSADEMGDVLFAVVNLGRHLGFDPESSLRAATAKFAGRLASVESLANARGLDLHTLDAAALDALWEEAKRTP